jgi:diacylglycerol kinase (ATP)
MAADTPVLQVLLNPNAAGSRGARIRPTLERELERAGLPYRLQATEGPGHARVLARALAEEGSPGPIVVAGGDGTIHEVANGLIDSGDATRHPLAILPVGTGNDFKQMVRGPGGIPALIALLKAPQIRAFDVGFARWEGGASHFVNLLGVGIDVEVLRRRARFHWLSGLPQYLAALTQALIQFRPRAMALTLEGGTAGSGEALRTPILLAAVTVGPTVGGGFRLSPAALPDDGLLDLFLAEPLSLFKVLRTLPRVIRGTHGGDPGIHLRTLTRARIVAQDGAPFAFELDGELGPQETRWLELELRPAALRILEPLV